MIKLITPPGMLLTVALQAIYSVYALLIGSIENSSILMVGGVVSVVAAYGTAMLRPWSQYLIYVLAAGFMIKLGHSIYTGIVSGYFVFQFGSVRESLESLGPSALMALLSCTCCFLVFRHFHPSQAAKHGVPTAPEGDQSAGGSKQRESWSPDE